MEGNKGYIKDLQYTCNRLFEDVLLHWKWLNIQNSLIIQWKLQSLKKIFPCTWLLLKTQFPTYYWTFLMFPKDSDNSCLNEYDTTCSLSIQNKTARRYIIVRFLSVHQHWIQSLLTGLQAKLHTRLTSVCLFVRFFLSAWWFLTILPIGLFHYIIWALMSTLITGLVIKIHQRCCLTEWA